MNRELDVFLQAIKQDFCWVLYSYEYVDTRIGSYYERTQRASFPFCCKLSAQLVSSFLYANYSNETEINGLEERAQLRQFSKCTFFKTAAVYHKKSVPAQKQLVITIQ